MNMKKLVALLLALVMVFALCACGPKDNQDTGKKDDGQKTAMKADDIPDEMTSSDGKYQVAFVTDVGELKDKSFNQGTYDGVKLYANANGKSYKYYQPANGDKATDDDRLRRHEGRCRRRRRGRCGRRLPAGALPSRRPRRNSRTPSSSSLTAIARSTAMTQGNILPTCGISFREEQCGYLAGYAAVMEGYTKLGFCGGGGGTNDACCRYGYGYRPGRRGCCSSRRTSRSR